jgi:uroporphyrinogen-III synthase
MQVLVTRPKGQADGLVERLQQADCAVTAIPMLDTLSSVSAASNEQLHNLASGQLVADYAVFISSNAVTYTAQWLRTQGLSWPKKLPCVPIGTATASAVSDNGWLLHSGNIGDQRSSEYMLDALLKAEPKAKTAVIVSGIGGRKILPDGLRRAGVEVISIETYQRIRPDYPIEPLRAQLFAFMNADHAVGKAIIFASGETLDNFAFYVEKTGQNTLFEVACVVPSPRVAMRATEKGFSKVTVANGASADAFAAALQTLAQSG